VDGFLVVHHFGRVAAALTLFVIACPVATTAARAPVVLGNDLAGTWQVSRACVSGCVGTTTVTEVVRPYRGTVSMATGGVTMLLYPIAAQMVLVHAAQTSSLLTIRVPGQLMRGPGVDQNGNTFTTTWRCVAAAGPGGVTALSHPDGVRPRIIPGARAIC
jgi:hypothetical protein